ncbi:MAG: hypothetical protein ACOCWA_09695 [Bacteroidota bacterium]
MIITAEISYYPLSGDIDRPILTFIEELKYQKDITVETGRMSTLVSGDYTKVMSIISDTMGRLMQEYPSVFNLKISNACPVG